jgi:NAD(P)-dependent dehydrogenase (short-subunit alcohol dehydrogenase family)
MRLAGKVAIISGAASGMGAATARMFAREGAKVVIADVMEHEGRQVADAIGAAARFARLDVTDEDNWAAVVADTTRQFGRLDVLVNNAGVSGSAEQDFFSTEAWHRIMAINATGVFFGIKHAIPAMKAAGGGSIVNLSSIAGIIGSEHVHMAYNASKAAVRLMTKATAVQHAKDNIRANSVHPGVMPAMRTSGRTADPAVRAERMRVIPMRRPGEVDEVAYAVLFLASDESSYITGSEIHVDGGAIAIQQPFNDTTMGDRHGQSTLQRTRCRSRHRSEDDRGGRAGHLRRHLGTSRPEQAGSQPYRHRIADLHLPPRPAPWPPGARAGQRRDEGRDRRGDHASCVLLRLAECDDSGAHRQGGVRGAWRGLRSRYIKVPS